MTQTEHNRKHTIRRLNISVWLNLIITLTEFIGGILTGSLSLLADALHNLTDTFSIFISIIAYKISLKTPDSIYTYGYQRAGILAGFINLTMLFGVSIYILRESIDHLLNPHPIDTGPMLLVAVIGLIANLLSGFLLFKDMKKNLNIRSAFLHILADALSSAGVILAGIIIYFTNFYTVDTVVSFIIAIYLLYASFGIAKQLWPILMQAVPCEYDIKTVTADMESLKNVEDIHHLHIWALDEHKRYLECHVKIKKDNLKKIETIKEELKKLLASKFKIYHSTLEFETDRCGDNMISKTT